MAAIDFIRGLFPGGSRPRLAPTQTQGEAGFVNLGGFIQDNERNAKLKGSQRYVTYSDLLVNTSIVAAGCRYFLGLVEKAGWRCVPSDEEDAEAKRFAEEMQEIIDEMDTPWSKVVRRAGMYRFYGFSVQEMTARRMLDGAGIGLMEIAPRPQHTIEKWDTDEHGRVRGMTQRSPQTGKEIYLDRRKVLYLVDDSLSDSPEGLGLFRHLVEPAHRLRRFEVLEAFGYETDLRGIPVGRAPLSDLQQQVANGTLSKEQAEGLVAPLKTFIEKHIKNPELGLLLDSITYQTLDEKGQPSNVPKWDLKLVTGDNANSTAAVATAIERLNREMARIMGVEHLLLGGDGKGSLALSRDKTQSFGLMVDGTLNGIGEQSSDDVVRFVAELRGWPRAKWPKMVPQPTKYRDVQQVADVLEGMAKAGAQLHPEDPAIGEVRELLGLSRPLKVISPLLQASEDKDKDRDAQGEQADKGRASSEKTAEAQAKARAAAPPGGGAAA